MGNALRSPGIPRNEGGGSWLEKYKDGQMRPEGQQGIKGIQAAVHTAQSQDNQQMDEDQ